MFKIGYRSGQQKRALRNATVHVNGQLPVLKGAEKDHKVNNGKIKMRPIENSMDGQTKQYLTFLVMSWIWLEEIEESMGVAIPNYRADANFF